MNQFEQGGAPMRIELSSQLLDEAKALVEENKGLEGPVGIPSPGGEVNAILSKNPNDLYPLERIEHGGEVYYLGLPKDEE